MTKKFRLNEGSFSRIGLFGGRKFTDDPNAKDYWDEAHRGEKLHNDDEEGRLFLKYLPWIIGALIFGFILGFGIGWLFGSSAESKFLSGFASGMATSILIAFLYMKGWRLCYLLFHGLMSAFRGK